jgi:hypothetical protein
MKKECFSHLTMLTLFAAQINLKLNQGLSGNTVNNRLTLFRIKELMPKRNEQA